MFWVCGFVLLLLVGVESFKTEGKSKRVFHDRISEKFSFDVCADGDRNSPDSIRLFDHSDNTSLSYGLTNKGIEHMVNNENIGFGIYPSSTPGIVTLQAWHKGAGKLVTMEVDLSTGQINNTVVYPRLNKIVPFCSSDAEFSVSKRSISGTIINFIRGSCRSLLSPIAWTGCRAHTTSICTGVALTLEAAIAIPGDSLIWFPVCKGALGLVCGQVGKADPTSAEVCQAMEQYIRDHIGSLFG